MAMNSIFYIRVDVIAVAILCFDLDGKFEVCNVNVNCKFQG